jgi:hypothetical protein
MMRLDLEGDSPTLIVREPMKWSNPPKLVPVHKKWIDPPKIVWSADCFARNGTVRRGLKRWWVDSPQRWLVWLMLNPSDATAGEEDPTTCRLTHFTRHWPKDEPYDGWIAVNLYPFVESSPKALWKRKRNLTDAERAEWNIDMATNLKDVREVGEMAAKRVLAYGAEANKKHTASIAKEYQDAFGSGEFWCLGSTEASKQPRHPGKLGRAPLDLPLKVFRYPAPPK